MKSGIDPVLFARLMKMSSETRRDLLEFFGQAPVDLGVLLCSGEAGTPQIAPDSRSS
ncbi:hypothetical protein HKCCE4037_16485 [Rhodobacterales bacterium HKCCE4037]|nr:hypothetical protein [Rhodobacterales bacterium HKCCE4037]